MKSKSVIVIGAGISGITAAVHLAGRGMQVAVLEKNDRPGGRCGRMEREGHQFDTGPTLFVMPLLYESEFRSLGVSLRERLALQRVDPTYHLVFDDGSRLALTSDEHSMREQLESIEPGSFRGFQRYMEEGGRHYPLALDRLVNRDFRKITDFFNLRNADLPFRLIPFLNHYRHMSSFFREPRLKSAFTFQDMYMGLSPFEAPATFSMMPYTELAHGVWYPQGGMHRIAETLADLARSAGVEFGFNTAVERIEVNGGTVRGVALADGSRRTADIVVANADLPYVYRDLLPDEGLARSMLRKEFSCSVISFFWGVDRKFEQLPPHTLFLSDDYRETLHTIIRDHGLPDNPSVYVHAPARLDPSMAPPGEDTLVATVPVGHMTGNGDQPWEEIRMRARGHVLRRLRLLGIGDLESHIKFEEAYTPPMWAERYNLVKGSTHGLSHRLTQMAYFRPSHRHPRYANMYFTGASTHPGTGLPNAMISARLVAERIVDEHSA
jgi:phytoene desaturase